MTGRSPTNWREGGKEGGREEGGRREGGGREGGREGGGREERGRREGGGHTHSLTQRHITKGGGKGLERGRH